MEVFPVSLIPSAPEGRPRGGAGVCLHDRVWWTDTHTAPRAGGAVHEAQDIFAPRGSLVLAPEAGRVLAVGHTAKGGHWVRLYAPASDRTYYAAHLEERAPVQAGQTVAAGEVIGRVGNSGNASEVCPHLHLRAARGPDRPVANGFRRGRAVQLAGELRALDPYRGRPPQGPLATPPPQPQEDPMPARDFTAVELAEWTELRSNIGDYIFAIDGAEGRLRSAPAPGPELAATLDTAESVLEGALAVADVARERGQGREALAQLRALRRTILERHGSLRAATAVLVASSPRLWGWLAVEDAWRRLRGEVEERRGGGGLALGLLGLLFMLKRRG